MLRVVFVLLLRVASLVNKATAEQKEQKTNWQQNEPKLYIPYIVSKPSEFFLIDMGDAQNEPKKEEGEKKVLHTYALVRVRT